MKKIVFLTALLVCLLSPISSQAQTATVRTRVGNPPLSSSVEGAAADLKGAYDKCGRGITAEAPGLGICLKSELLARGYSDSAVAAFETRRMQSLVFHSPYAAGCTECLGFVGVVLTLLSGSTDTLFYNSAADIYPLSSFPAGTITFKKIDSTEPLLPGDIGAKAGGNGHIAIVNQPLGNIKFSALESNGNVDCRVTDSREILREPYVFFRMQ